MKRILKVLFLVVLVLLSSQAMATLGYCNLCGRVHSEKMCPEQCINDCELNEKGVIHKWYECPHRTIGTCWYCGEKTEFHNENCCPRGEVIWNDVLGTFKTKEYANEEGARYPEFCNYCGYYGYHASNECINRPIKVTNAPQHKHSFTTWLSTEYELVGSKELCGWEATREVIYCKSCELIESDSTAYREVEHWFNNGICVNCGYKKEIIVVPTIVITATPIPTVTPILAATPIPTATPIPIVTQHTTLTPAPVVTPTKVSYTPSTYKCRHNGAVYTSCVTFRIKYQRRDYSCTVYTYRDVCSECNEVIREYEKSQLVEHEFEKGVCKICGYRNFNITLAIGAVIFLIALGIGVVYFKKKK